MFQCKKKIYISFKLCYLCRPMLSSNKNRGKINILKTADKLQKRAIMSRKKTFSYSSKESIFVTSLQKSFFLCY